MLLNPELFSGDWLPRLILFLLWNTVFYLVKEVSTTNFGFSGTVLAHLNLEQNIFLLKEVVLVLLIITPEAGIFFPTCQNASFNEGNCCCVEDRKWRLRSLAPVVAQSQQRQPPEQLPINLMCCSSFCLRGFLSALAFLLCSGSTCSISLL